MDLKSSCLIIQRLTPTSVLPKRATLGSAGYDLFSDEETHIPPGGRATVKLGLCMSIPKGTYGQIAPRSGLALRHGIHVGAGVVDTDYTGEVCVLLFNLGGKDFLVQKGARVAQLILHVIRTPPVVTADKLSATKRGAGGFGSTGV